MLRRRSRTSKSFDELQVLRKRPCTGASQPEPRLTAATAGQQAIELLNKGDLHSFCELLERMEQQGTHKLDLSHDPNRQGSPTVPPLISELGMECLAKFFERSDEKTVSRIRELDFAGAHVATLDRFLTVLEQKNGRHLERLDFSGTRVRKGAKAYPLQTKHFQRIAQVLANAPHLKSLGLNHQPLLRGQKAGAVRELPPEVAHLQRYVPEEADTDVPSSVPELVNAVCVATACRCFRSLELRGCNLSDDDLSTLWPIIDTSAPIDAKEVLIRGQLARLDLRSNPMMSYGNRLVMLANALSPTGTLQHLYLPSQFKNVYRQLYEHDRKKLHGSLANSEIQVLEPFTSAEEPEFKEVQETLASRRSTVSVAADDAYELRITDSVPQNLNPSTYV